jgi:hypothetical protein
MAKQTYTVKGTHIITSRAWTDEQLGEGTFNRLSDKEQAPWGLKPLPSGWYDVFALMRVMEPVCARLKISVFDAFTDIATRNARDDLTTIYRAFLRLAGARGLLNATPTLWRNYVAFGTVEKLANQPGFHEAIDRGIPTPLLDWACACWNGFIPTAVVLAGGSNPELKIVDTGPDTKADEPDLSYLHVQLHYVP